MPLPGLGPDDVTLIFRDPVLDDDGHQTYDENSKPIYVDRPVNKSGAKFTITGVTQSGSAPPVTIYAAKAALEVDSDSLVLAKKDAISHDDKVFELLADARVKRTLIDKVEHHVRVFCAREEPAGSGELVRITPRGGQDDDGVRLPDGVPFDVLALAVDAGNTAEKYGAAGTVDEADFTVVLPLGAGVGDGDWIRVRGRDCVARVQREFSQQATRNQDVVLARSLRGGS